MPGIVVGIDGSEHSRRALEWAAREAALRRAPLTGLTVHQAVADYWGAASLPEDAALAKQALEAAEAETDRALKAIGEAPKPSAATVKATTGLPAEELLHAADGADILVVGSRGTGGFRRLLMGSVSTQVTHHARCPVVVIPAG